MDLAELIRMGGLSFKGGGDGMDGNGAKMFASIFHGWSHNHVVNFSICLRVHAHIRVRFFVVFVGSRSNFK